MERKEIITAVSNGLLSSGQYKEVFLSVPFEKAVIDIVLLDGTGRLTTVMVAEDNWKLALRQARANALGADYSYICVPTGKQDEERFEAVNMQGLGLMIFSPATGRIQTKSSPHQGALWQRSRHHLLQTLGLERAPAVVCQT